MLLGRDQLQLADVGCIPPSSTIGSAPEHWPAGLLPSRFYNPLRPRLHGIYFGSGRGSKFEAPIHIAKQQIVHMSHRPAIIDRFWNWAIHQCCQASAALCADGQGSSSPP